MDEKGKLSRRGFVGAAGGAAAAASLGPLVPGASGHGRGGRRGDRLLPRDRIGIQLFTVRDQVASLGFEEVFRRLSAIGYREIEFAGYSAQGRRWTNQELRRLLRRYGLRRRQPRQLPRLTRRPTRSSTTSSRCSTTPRRSACRTSAPRTAPGQRYGETVAGYRRAAEDFNHSARPRGRAGCASTSTTTPASSRSRTAPGCTT